MAKFNLAGLFKRGKKSAKDVPVEEMSLNELLNIYNNLVQKKRQSHHSNADSEELKQLELEISYIEQLIRARLTNKKDPEVQAFIKETEEDFIKYYTQKKILEDKKRYYRECEEKLSILELKVQQAKVGLSEPLSVEEQNEILKLREMNILTKLQDIEIDMIPIDAILPNIIMRVSRLGVPSEMIQSILENDRKAKREFVDKYWQEFIQKEREEFKKKFGSNPNGNTGFEGGSFGK